LAGYWKIGDIQYWLEMTEGDLGAYRIMTRLLSGELHIDVPAGLVEETAIFQDRTGSDFLLQFDST